MKFSEFLKIGISEFQKKLASIPETEPLYNIIKSRTIKIGEIKDKEERKYWQKMKRNNRIPNVYLSNKEIYENLKESSQKLGGLNGKRFN